MREFRDESSNFALLYGCVYGPQQLICQINPPEHLVIPDGVEAKELKALIFWGQLRPAFAAAAAAAAAASRWRRPVQLVDVFGLFQEGLDVIGEENSQLSLHRVSVHYVCQGAGRERDGENVPPNTFFGSLGGF